MILDLEDLPLEKREEIIQFQKMLAMAEATSPTLAAHVVLYKSLGLFKSSAMICMSELIRRRSLGEVFDFESFIDLELNKIPKVQPIDFTAINALINVKQISGFISKGSK